MNNLEYIRTLKSLVADFIRDKQPEDVSYYQEVCDWLDSLPAESPDFEAEWKRYTASRKDDMRTNAVTMNVKEVAKHFAEWQKQQDESNREEIYRAGVRDGMRYFKEQMMKEAINVTIGNFWGHPDFHLTRYILEPLGIKQGNKVKLIILKEA